MTFPALIQLSGIALGDGSQGFVIHGIDPADQGGYSVASAGDVNGDGIDDFIIGAPGADPGGDASAGESYVVFGRASGFGPILDLASLNGSNGFIINGIDPDDQSGSCVASAGDLNGDGIGDLIIGAYAADPDGRESAGESYVVFGSAEGFAASLDLSALDGTNGFAVNGIDPLIEGSPTFGDNSGWSVAGAGDFNGDGIEDLIIGAFGASPEGRDDAGASYIVFGSAAARAASLDLSTLDGTNGLIINGIDAAVEGSAGDLSGWSVAGAGDVNGDGIDDVIIGAINVDSPFIDQGQSYIVFGNTAGFASIDLASLNGINGFSLTGIDGFDQTGWSVAGAGDVNGDGIDDVIVGSRFADPSGNSDSGESYVVFGSASGFAANIDLASLNGTNGFTITGIEADDHSGTTVASAGDVNGDGIGDLIIRAPAELTGVGQSYVVFGTAAGFSATLDLSTLDGTNGFVISGSGVGSSASGAGDVNGDGYDDVIVGSLTGTPEGDSYVIYGRTMNQTEGTAGNDALLGGTGDDRLNGYAGNDTLAGGLRADIMAGGAGDDFYDAVTFADTVIELDGEGTDTVRTRVDGYTLGANVENLVLFGSTVLTASGNALANSITGTEHANDLYGFDGNDTLFGRGGDDTLFAGNGNDTLDGGSGADAMLGGRGDDFYDLVAAADTVIEFAGQGTDTVRTRAASYALGANLENLILLGTVATSGTGNALANAITGTDRANSLLGLAGNDNLGGFGGNDTLSGGAGFDTVTGGAGADAFTFDDGDFAGLGSNSADRVTDFTQGHGDTIDLSAVDAIAGNSSSAFTFIGAAAFSGNAGELRFVQRVDNITMIQGDTDGDGTADFAIRLDGLVDLTAGDFVL